MCEHDWTTWQVPELLWKGNNYDMYQLVDIRQCLECGEMKRYTRSMKRVYRQETAKEIDVSTPTRFGT